MREIARFTYLKWEVFALTAYYHYSCIVSNNNKKHFVHIPNFHVHHAELGNVTCRNGHIHIGHYAPNFGRPSWQLWNHQNPAGPWLNITNAAWCAMRLRGMRRLQAGRFFATLTIAHKCLSSLGQSQSDCAVIQRSDTDGFRVVMGVASAQFSRTWI